MAGFLTRDTKSASLENHYAELSIGLEEEMLLVNEANDDIAAAEEEVQQVEAAENVVVAADQTADLIEKNNGELDENGVIAVDNLQTAANNISIDDGVNNPGDPLNESETEKLIPVVESSGKFYVSIEGFRETFAKIKKKILEIVASIWKRIKEAYRKYFGAYTSLIKRGTELATRADNMSGKTIASENKTFEITSGFQYLCIGDTSPTATPAGVTAMLDKVKGLAAKNSLNALEALGKNLVEKIKGADFNSDAEVTTGVDSVTAAITTYINAVGGNAATSGGFIGQTEWKVEGDRISGTGTDKLNIMLQKRWKLEEGSTKLKDSYKFQTMTSSEVKKAAETVAQHAKDLKGYEVGMDKLEKHQKDIATATNVLEGKANKAESDEDNKIAGLVSAYNAIVRSNTYYANQVTTLAKALKISTNAMQNVLYWGSKSLDLHKSK
jgi:hypothetical protein